VAYVIEKLTILSRRKDDLESTLREKTRERHDFASHKAGSEQSAQEIKTLIARIQGPASENLFSTRARVASYLRSILLKLTVAAPMVREQSGQPSDRKFSVCFLDGRIRSVTP
jgi:hypothetical protein